MVAYPDLFTKKKKKKSNEMFNENRFAPRYNTSVLICIKDVPYFEEKKRQKIEKKIRTQYKRVEMVR